MSDPRPDLGDIFRRHRDLVRARKYTEARSLVDEVAARGDLLARHPALVERFLAAHRALEATRTRRFDIPDAILERSRRQNAQGKEGDQGLRRELRQARDETERLRRQLHEVTVHPPARVPDAWKEEREQLYRRISRLEALAQRGGLYRELYAHARSVLREVLAARRTPDANR